VEDRASLHYVERLLTEIIRWHPSAPFGMWMFQFIYLWSS
jgi:hypothetical protein